MKCAFDFDKVFPNAGGIEFLNTVRHGLSRNRSRDAEGTVFTQEQIEHIRKMFDACGEDEESRSTLMMLVCYVDNQSRLARSQF